MSIMQLTQTIQFLPPATINGENYPSQPALPGLEPEEATPPIIYRIQAYRNAARGVLELHEPAAEIIRRGEILPVPGLGRRLQFRIVELIHTGTMTFYNDLFMQSLPPAVRRLMAVEHVGPRSAIRLYEELGINTPEQLWWAAHQQRIRKLRGFGVRSEARLKMAAGKLLGKTEQVQLGGVA